MPIYSAFSDLRRAHKRLDEAMAAVSDAQRSAAAVVIQRAARRYLRRRYGFFVDMESILPPSSDARTADLVSRLVVEQLGDWRRRCTEVACI